MPRLQDQHQSSFFHAQNQQQPPPPQWQQQQVLPTFAPPPQQQQQNQITTQISPLSTSGSASPTSPKAYHTRQIRPLYMPAVLRPTEHHSKPPPTRQPKAADTSDDEDDRTLRSNSSFITLSGALGRLSRRSTGDSGKCVDGNWNLDAFAKPTGLPTREHWKVCLFLPNLSPLMVCKPPCANHHKKNSPTTNPQSATTRPAGAPSATSRGATTAGAAATSSATSTRPSRCPSTRAPTSTRAASPCAPAPTATASSRSGAAGPTAGTLPAPPSPLLATTPARVVVTRRRRGTVRCRPRPSGARASRRRRAWRTRRSVCRGTGTGARFEVQ